MFTVAFFLKWWVLWLPMVVGFTHPGLLVTETDLSRAKDNIAAQKDPWCASWNKLVSMEYTSAAYTHQAVATVDRDADSSTAANADRLWHDAAAAFALALRWKISGNDSYADAAVNILRAWGETLVSVGANDDQYLVSGLQGHELANAGELLRDYAPFVADGQTAFLHMMTDVFLAKNTYFLEHRAGSEHNVKHFFANWELANVASAMAIGVLTNNQTVYDFAVDYFKNGEGNGAINNAVTNIVSEPGTGNLLGQGQEEGRDQGHSALDFQLLGVIAQQAWNQGEDLFGYNDSRILLGAEYFARYNLGNEVPFEPYTNGIVSYTEISSASRGAIRPAWELLYNHYVLIKGQNAPWTTKYWNQTLDHFGGFEPGAGAWGEGSGHYDSLGWGSLLYRREESDATNRTSAPAASPTVAILSGASHVVSAPSAALHAASATSRSVVPTNIPPGIGPYTGLCADIT
ncbi:hypothetical protein BBP40_006218 [Aspergillus hancockii]|nr:hypothetical protein BBP40_006218 [Aspergillus hancockii]